MRCPYCRNQLAEDSPECPSCHLTLGRVRRLLGPAPLLKPGICDTTRLLGGIGERRVRATLGRLHRCYPQVSVHILLREFSTAQPLELQTFWLFNTANLVSQNERGPLNRSVMLAIDPPNQRAAVMIGYGLEPFLGDEALDRLLETAEPAWRSGKFAEGILTVLGGLGELLAGVIDSLPEALGIAEQESARTPAEF